MTDRPRVKFLTCKRCGCSIETGLCGYTCDLDSTPASERRPEDMEVRVYEFIGVEGQPAAPLPASAALQDLIAKWRERASEWTHRKRAIENLQNRGHFEGAAAQADYCADELEAALQGIAIPHQDDQP